MTDQNTLIKIRNYGALKFSAEKICQILGLRGDEKEHFLLSFDDPESDIRQFYDQGTAIGEYNIDAELAKKAETGDIFSIIEQSKRQYHRRIDDMKKNLFGV